MIRRAKMDDIESLNNLLGEVLLTHHSIRPDIFKDKGAKYNRDELSKLINNDKKPIFIYEDNNKVIGHLFLEIREYEANVIIPYKSLFIDDLCVLKEYRGQGIGKELMEYAFEYAKRIGARNIELNVWNKNDSAIKFYESLGLTVQKYTLEKSI